ncbi:AAA family ATPase [Fibrobacterota bacterium]
MTKAEEKGRETLKIAISGKGGVGKTTIAAMLARAFSDEGAKVFTIDADPDANLANALGFSEEQEITPLAEMKELIKERVGAEPGKSTVYFTMNPKVDDIPDRFSVEKDGIKHMVMGTVRRGGGGCVCPENVMVKQLLSHLLVARDEIVIIDMEAGIEHLGRGTAQFVDLLLVVVEATTSSLQTFDRIKKLAGDLNIKQIAVIANKVRKPEDLERIISETGAEVLSAVPYDETLLDYRGFSINGETKEEIYKVKNKLEQELTHG